jgi:predicted ATPase
MTGLGGTGKTRRPQAAGEASGEFPDGIWWVGLAPLRDARLLVSSLAQALMVEQRGDPDLTALVVSHLSGKRALILVDNTEHLLPEVASEITLLRDAVGPTILVTSRERLQLQGEHVYPVPTLAAADGIELFLDRAAALASGVEASDAIGELCSRLDNLPLALELAAARTVVFQPEQPSLGFRSGSICPGGRDADPRQQTLRATIEWSYDCSNVRSRTFRGSRLRQRLHLRSGRGCLRADPDTIQALDKSLLAVPNTTHPATGCRDDPRAHARGWPRRARTQPFGGSTRSTTSPWRAPRTSTRRPGPAAACVVIPERDNMRAVLAWAFAAGEREFGLELVVALENWWVTTARRKAWSGSRPR